MEMKNPNYYDARVGDVVHVRTSNFYGKLIRKCLPGSWGNHDGTLVKTSDGWGVAEALLSPGFVITPWKSYQKRAEKDKVSIVFLRIKDTEHDMNVELGKKVAYFAEDMAFYHIQYDTRAVIGIFFNLIFKRNLKLGKKWKWYCTNSVATHHYKATEDHRLDVWDWHSSPTPLTTEKRHSMGLLRYVNGVFCKDYPEYVRN